ncbi:MAG: phytanoyl-CoA dioxygenase family protein [Alphaproteobacteria bacterium]|nr:phytanoyl-CoA dioxygenase family protein [Alphaproteobacteria bacterium]
MSGLLNAKSDDGRAADEDVDSLVADLRTQGVVVVRDVLSAKECDFYRGRLDRQLKERIDSGSYCGNETNQVLDNYFQTDQELLPLIYQELTDRVMRRMIDDDYVLISPSARNRRTLSGFEFGRKTSGVGWHTDSRFIGGGQGTKPSLCYMTILCVDAFAKENGATHFIPNSHLRYQRPADRDADLDYNFLIAPQGAMVIFDTALWHRIGDGTEKSRWGVFNTYGPWFMKPYHRFDEMVPRATLDEMPPIFKQLLHLDSIPPKDHNESMITLRRVRAAVEGQ